MIENALREQQTPNCDYLPATTTGPNNNVKPFLPNVSWRIFLFLFFSCLFPWVISISGQYRYDISPLKLKFYLMQTDLETPFYLLL